MGYIIIDGLGSARVSNPPNATALGNLWHYLYGWANAGRDVVINGYGSALGPGKYIGWTPTNVAEFIKAGNVFIDWCEWPMFYQVAVNGTQTTLGAAGFQGFSGQIGYTWLSDETFYVGLSGTYPLTHGYLLKGSQNGVFLPDGTTKYAAHLPLEGNFVSSTAYPVATSGVAAMMGLHHPGIGWYFYAAFDPVPNPVQRVPHEVYGAFIGAVLHGQLDTIVSTAVGDFQVHQSPYSAPTQTLRTTAAGPTSPYHTVVSTSSSGTRGTYPTTGVSSSPVSTTTPPASSLPWQEILAGSALVGGAGVMVAVLVTERRRRLEGEP